MRSPWSTASTRASSTRRAGRSTRPRPTSGAVRSRCSSDRAGPPELLEYDASLRPPAERPEVLDALEGKPADLWLLDHSHTLIVFYRAEPLSDGRILYLAQGIARGATALHDLRWQLLNLTLFLFLLAFVLGVSGVLWIVSPLERMQQRVRAYLDGGPRPKLAIDRGDEIGALSRDFQEMIDRQQEQLARTTRATSDMTHDLKNRVASIAAGAEMLEDGGDERVVRIAKVIKNAGQQLERSLEAMLELAQLEERLPTTDARPVDLGELCREILEGYEQDIRLEAEPAPVAVIGDTMERAIRNLIDNALAFSREAVELSVSRKDDEVVLIVADDGPGVSEGNRPRIFDRFFSARDGGTGLGLAIVKTVVEAHRGTIVLVDDGPLPGACFAVTLPARPLSQVV